MLHGTAITTTTWSAASVTLASRAPIVAANSETASTPRLLAMLTSCPAETNCRASALPIPPVPMIPIFIAIP